MDKFFTYIILTSNNKYYVGHTKSLLDRLNYHQNDKGAKFLVKNKPLKIVWHQEFNNKLEAIRREKQIKGWKREKKESLIKLDKPLIYSTYAKTKIRLKYFL